MADVEIVCNCTYTGSGRTERREPSGDCPYHGRQ
jgi:hypothetical protein